MSVALHELTWMPARLRAKGCSHHAPVEVSFVTPEGRTH